MKINLVRYTDLELHKWKETVKEPCAARRSYQPFELIGSLSNSECKITNRDCLITNCFALQVIKLSKGFL